MVSKQFLIHTTHWLLLLGMLLFLAACDPEPPSERTRTPMPEATATAVVDLPTFVDQNSTPLANTTFDLFCYEQAAYSDLLLPRPRQPIETDPNGRATTWPDNCRYVTAVEPQTAVSNKYDLYRTSWKPGDTTADDAADGIVTMQQHPLVVFHPVVSLAWEPDPETYVASLDAAFRAANEYLYDVSNGQMLFGQVSILTNGEGWEEADFRILADNDRRPSANVGGIVPEPGKHLLPNSSLFNDIIFYPGHITLGRGWSDRGPSQGAWNEPDGSRTLVHEWGHYALFLFDEYLALDNSEASCECDHKTGSCPSSIMDWHYQPERSEFWGMASDATMCQKTLHGQVYEQSDWKIIAQWFDWQNISPAPFGLQEMQPGVEPNAPLTFARHLFATGFSPSAPLVPIVEPALSITTGPTSAPTANTQLLAQVYTLQQPKDSSGIASSILYQGSSLLFGGNNPQQQLQLLGLPQTSGQSLYIGVNQFTPGASATYETDALTHTSLLPQPMPDATSAAVFANNWQPQLDVQFNATMIDSVTQTAVVTDMTLTLTLNANAGGEVLVQLCTPGQPCSGPWPISDGTPGQTTLTINAGELGDRFPNYAILRLWVPTAESITPRQLIRWLEIGRPGAGPGGGCAHAPLRDGNQTRTLGMTQPADWENCSGLVAYMPFVNDVVLQTAVPNTIQGFVAPPVQIQDIKLDNETCSATADSAITFSYNELAVCQLVVATVPDLGERGFEPDTVGYAADFTTKWAATDGRLVEDSPTLTFDSNMATKPANDLIADCANLLSSSNIEEQWLQLVQLDKEGRWQPVGRQVSVNSTADFLTATVDSDGIFAIVLAANTSP